MKKKATSLRFWSLSGILILQLTHFHVSKGGQEVPMSFTLPSLMTYAKLIRQAWFTCMLQLFLRVSVSVYHKFPNKKDSKKKENNNFLLISDQGTHNRSKILSAAFASASSVHLAAPSVANIVEKNHQASVEKMRFFQQPPVPIEC